MLFILYGISTMYNDQQDIFNTVDILQKVNIQFVYHCLLTFWKMR